MAFQQRSPAWNKTWAVRPVGLPALSARQSRVFDRYGIPLGLFGLAWLVYALINNGRAAYYDYFVPLGGAFLHGQLGLSAMPDGFSELVRGTNELWNVVYPPMPAVLLMPFVLVLGTALEQSWASIVLGAVNVALVSIVIQQMGVARLPRIVLSLVFGFGTIVWFSAQIGTAWHFAHVVAIFFTLLSIFACMRNWPTVIIGLLFGAAVLARLPVALAAPFFLAYIAERSLREPDGRWTGFGHIGAGRRINRQGRFPVRRFLELAIPWAFGAGIFAVGYLAYNFLRFGSLLETGHDLVPMDSFLGNGVFTLASVPRLLVAMFLSGPERIEGFPFFQPRLLGGLSILLTSPIMLWAFNARRLTWFNIGAWSSVVLILVPIMLHAEEGGTQFGFRYAQDVYPFLFVLTVIGLRGRISGLAWVAISVGVIVNLWGMASTYNAWLAFTVPDSQVPFFQVGSLRVAAAALIVAGVAVLLRRLVPRADESSTSAPLASTHSIGDVEATVPHRRASVRSRMPFDIGGATMAKALIVAAGLLGAFGALYQILTSERITYRLGCGFDGSQYCQMAAGQLGIEPFNRRVLLPGIVNQLGLSGADGFALVNAFVIFAVLCAFVYLCTVVVGRGRSAGLARPRVPALVAIGALAVFAFITHRNTIHLYLSYPALSDYLALFFLFLGCIAIIKATDDDRWAFLAAGAAFAGALSRENLAIILAVVAVIAGLVRLVRWPTVVATIGAGAAGTYIAFAQPFLPSQSLSIVELLNLEISQDFGSAEGFLRFAIMALLGIGPMAILCVLSARTVWRDPACLILAATGLVFAAISVFAGGDTDRILMPAGLLFAACAIRLYALGEVGLAPMALFLGAMWIWQLPLTVVPGDPDSWLSFWGLRVTPIDNVLLYGLAPILIGAPLVIAGLVLALRPKPVPIGIEAAE